MRVLPGQASSRDEGNGSSSAWMGTWTWQSGTT